MDIKQIYELLERANSSKQDEFFFIRPLQANVDIALLWLPIDFDVKDMPDFFGPITVYLIKNNDKQYIGLVEDRGRSDLHWYTLPRYRGKGYLSNALREIILPHLFLNRGEQNITISYKSFDGAEPVASALLARTIGFQFIDKNDDLEEYMDIPGKLTMRFIDKESSDLAGGRVQQMV
ncbi:hypothetical protein [Mucilaginibacter sp. FT3.2]|uniref:hypothetical protein n=1 Tax=Mucilaginibacter sp. FT3.2 TaxID=2723090 RepID=UPI0016179D33|nr:hypothetical protein [Mucilaginibacter sp. FT3.2]MBB6231490.1 hypothetical protein [Mucilaginibacter sp. FT3.2]